jgi:hypothetical protein
MIAAHEITLTSAAVHANITTASVTPTIMLMLLSTETIRKMYIDVDLIDLFVNVLIL